MATERNGPGLVYNWQYLLPDVEKGVKENSSICGPGWEQHRDVARVPMFSVERQRRLGIKPSIPVTPSICFCYNGCQAHLGKKKITSIKIEWPAEWFIVNGLWDVLQLLKCCY